MSSLQIISLTCWNKWFFSKFPLHSLYSSLFIEGQPHPFHFLHPLFVIFVRHRVDVKAKEENIIYSCWGGNLNRSLCSSHSERTTSCFNEPNQVGYFCGVQAMSDPPPAKRQRRRAVFKLPSGSSCHTCRSLKGLYITYNYMDKVHIHTPSDSYILFTFQLAALVATLALDVTNGVYLANTIIAKKGPKLPLKAFDKD